MPTVRRGDADVAYTVHGSGRGLVLVHGTGTSGIATWSTVLRPLSQSRTVVLPDLRGSGATRAPDAPLEIETLVDDVLAVAADAHLNEFDIAGFSLGGAVAASVAAAAADRVGALVVIAARASGTDSHAQLQFEFWKDLHAQDTDLFARYWLLAGLSPAFVASIPQDELASAASFRIEPGLARQSTLNTRLDIAPILGTIRARTLVIGCLHDAIVPCEQTRALADAIPGAKYLECHSGHMMMLEAPDLLARKILEHLADD